VTESPLRSAPSIRALPGRRRRRLRRLVALAVTVAALPLLLAGCRAGEPARGGAAGVAPSSPAGGSCAGVRFPECRSVVLASGQQVRYAVLRPDAPAEAESRAVVVDLGGPGIALFGLHWPGATLRTEVPVSLRSRPLIVIEEPWVTAAYPERCKLAATGLFRSVHGSAGTGDDAAAGTVSDCDLFSPADTWGWTPESYQESLQRILGAERLSLDGYLGLSFGAHRLTYLRSPVPKWAILVNPAPLAMSGSDYLSGRQKSLWSTVSVRCPGCPDPSTADRLLRRAERTLKAGPMVTSHRSVPLDVGDLGAAVMALGYRDQAVMKAFFRALQDLSVAANRELIGKLADSVWGRYGVDTVSPSVLAYWAEVCPSYGPWPAGTASRAVGGFLPGWHGPCRSVPAEARRRWDLRTDPGTRICVSALQDDPVVPAGSARTWRAAGAAVLPLRAGGVHADFAGSQDCADRLQL
jgi:hypothetical protein